VVAQSLNPHQHYLKTQIETASQPQLLLMLYDAAVKKLHLSKKAIETKAIEKAHTELTKVQRIFTELMIALDVEKGGELAQNLMRIYDFVYHHLVKANIRQDVALVDEVLPIVETLREGWVQAVAKFEEEQGMASSTKVPSNESVAPVRFDSKGMGKPAMPSRERVSFSSPQPEPAMASRPVVDPPKAAEPYSQPLPSAETPPVRPRLNLRG
jgi:flagellar protein FliS